MRTLTRGETMARAMFRNSHREFAVTSMHHGVAELRLYRTRDEAWTDFQTQGSDPAYREVALHVARTPE